jgi:hypothetical protein
VKVTLAAAGNEPRRIFILSLAAQASLIALIDPGHMHG